MNKLSSALLVGILVLAQPLAASAAVYDLQGAFCMEYTSGLIHAAAGGVIYNNSASTATVECPIFYDSDMATGNHCINVEIDDGNASSDASCTAYYRTVSTGFSSVALTQNTSGGTGVKYFYGNVSYSAGMMTSVECNLPPTGSYATYLRSYSSTDSSCII